ncbi:MAG: DUF3179 domain-containing protein [Candidatus Aenigmarchaeota archaeon]|nr:DUF3179 domain-containing protein [Candidatus Aenigmarchaeota archaeon]
MKRQQNLLVILSIAVIAGIIFILENSLQTSVSESFAGAIEPTSASADIGVNVDNKAPDFTLEDSKGNKVKLSDFRGKVVFLNFWASWCPFCIDEMPDIQKVAKEFDNVVVLFINRGETKSVAQNYLDRTLPVRIIYPILWDPAGTVSKVYILFGMPVSYVIDENGIIKDRKFGPLTEDEIRKKLASVIKRAKPVDEKEVSKEVKEEIKTLSDGTKYLVHPNLILSGGPPKGGIGVDRGIPAIINPKFENVDQATWLSDNDLIFGIIVDDIARAYPKQILVYHEIANDRINDKPLLVTYCPLCGTGIAFERKLPTGEESNFGTSGKLYNSNLVMYDDKTDTYWTQVGGKAIVGELTGAKLKQIPIDTMLWKDWKKLHPNTQVLSRNTGYIRAYGLDPYGDYYSNDFVGFGASFSDARLHPKAMVSGITINGIAKAYPVEEVGKAGLVNDAVNNISILVVKDPSIDIKQFEINPLRMYNRELEGKILEFELREGKLFDKQTNSEWNFGGVAIDGQYKREKLFAIDSTSAMWFSWLSFNPKTELFKS